MRSTAATIVRGGRTVLPADPGPSGPLAEGGARPTGACRARSCTRRSERPNRALIAPAPRGSGHGRPRVSLPNAKVSQRTRRIRVRRNPRSRVPLSAGSHSSCPRIAWRDRAGDDGAASVGPSGARRTSAAQIGRSGSAPLLRAESRHAIARGARGRGCPIPAAPVTALTRDNVAALLDERACRWRGSHCSTWSRLSHKSPSDPVCRSVMGRPIFKAAAHRQQMGRHLRQRRESPDVSHHSGS